MGDGNNSTVDNLLTDLQGYVKEIKKAIHGPEKRQEIEKEVGKTVLALAKFEDDRIITLLLDTFTLINDEDVVTLISKMLEQYASPYVIEELSKKLNGVPRFSVFFSPFWIIASIELLGKIGDDNVINVLTRLKDRSDEHTQAVFHAFARINSERTISILERELLRILSSAGNHEKGHKRAAMAAAALTEADWSPENERQIEALERAQKPYDPSRKPKPAPRKTEPDWEAMKKAYNRDGSGHGG